MIAAAARQTGQLIIYIADDPLDEATIKSVKESMLGAIILADLLEPLYDASIPTRKAAHTLGRVKAELESLVEQGARVVVICRRHAEDLGTRCHFLASLCASADRVHSLKRT
jgi:hypothetical protein